PLHDVRPRPQSRRTHPVGTVRLLRNASNHVGEGGVTVRGLYYEEFEVGHVFEHAIGRTVTEMDNTLFSCLTHNPQPLHIDHAFAAQTEWGKPLVNSLFTLGLMIGISVSDTTLGTTIAN